MFRSTTMILVSAVVASTIVSAQTQGDPAAILGTWRGTSTCADRVAAPGCADETVVYHFARGTKPGVIRCQADKIVDGKPVDMGDQEFSWDAAESALKAKYGSPRGKTIWKMRVDGTHITGTAEMLPGNKIFRNVDLKKE